MKKSLANLKTLADELLSLKEEQEVLKKQMELCKEKIRKAVTNKSTEFQDDEGNKYKITLKENNGSPKLNMEDPNVRALVDKVPLDSSYRINSIDAKKLSTTDDKDILENKVGDILLQLKSLLTTAVFENQVLVMKKK